MCKNSNKISKKTTKKDKSAVYITFFHVFILVFTLKYGFFV